MKVNLCFEYNRKSQTNQDSILKQNTFEKSIIMQPGNNEVFIELNFGDSLIGFTNMSSEEDLIYIFIEINKQRIFNPKFNNYCHFLLKLKDIVNKTNSTLKIQNFFTISFDSVIYKNKKENKIKNNNNINNNNNTNNNNNNNKKENNIDSESESSSDSDEAEESKIIDTSKNNLNESENKDDKIKEMRRISNLFRRIKIINDLMLLKNCTLEEFLCGKKNKDTSESKNENDEKNKIVKDINLIKEQHVDKEKIKIEEKNVNLSNFMKKDQKNEISENKEKKHVKINPNNEIKVKDSNANKFGNHSRCKTSENLGQKEKIERSKTIEEEFEEKNDKDNLLASMDYKSYLNEINEKKKLKKNIPIRDTFCSGFFITSIPCKKASIIEKSESYPSQCFHKFCSILSSMEPEILMRYPLEDSDEIEISDLAATLCFPAGIKICHSDSDPPKMKDYLTLLTNKVGDRLYIMTYHFYLKMDKNEFDKKYDDYPLKQKLKQLDDKIKGADLKVMNTKNNKYFEELKVYKELEFKKFIYIPYCLALISKYPYKKQIKQSLECIFKIIEYQAYNEELELNELLMYLIHSIPSPNKYSIVSFPLPQLIYNNKNRKNITVDLDLPSDTNILNSNLCEIMKLFRIKNIIRIIRLLLFEKKIVFIDNDYSRLTNVINSFLSLIYPFQWVHICIPIMSIQILKYLETFVPYLAGVHTSFVPLLNKYLSQNSNEKEQVYLIYIEEDKIRISDYLNGNEKKINKIRFIHENLVNLPVWMYITLTHLLSDVQNKVKNSNERENLEYNKDIQNAFLEIFVEMFADYNKYIYKIGDETFFNKDEFLAKKSYFEKSFFKEFIETQMFYQFKNDILNDGYENFKNKISDRNYDYIREKLGESKLRKSQFNLLEKEKTTYKINHKFKNVIKEKDKISSNEENYIVTYISNIKDENYKEQRCIIYFLPDLQTIGSMVSKSGNGEKEQNKESKQKITEEERSKKIHMNKIKEEIKNYILKIFKTDINVKDNNYTNVLKILKEEKNGREYFINLISKNLNSIIFLSKNSFNVLFELISEVLLVLEKQTKANDLYKELALLIKSTMNYGSKGKMKTTIWDLIKDKLKGKPLIHQERLWNEWYLLELNESINLNGIYLNEVKNIILVEISKAMKSLGIEKNLIIKYTNNLMKNHFENNEIIKKTKNDILSHINI